MAGIINNIRTKGSIILVVLIGLAMASFVLTDILGRIRDIIYPQRTNVVGIVAGEKIQPDFFKYRVDLNVMNEKIQIKNQGTQREVDRNQAENRTWYEVVEEIINSKEYEKIGLKITDAEYKDMISGPNPDEEVLRTIGTPDKIKEYVKQAEKDGDLRFQLQMLENYLQKNRLRNKYNALIKNGTYVSKAEARKKYIEENRKITFDYLAVNFSQIPDSAIKPSESDYKKVYQENIEEFKQNGPEAILYYVKFDKTPTKSDSSKALEYLNNLITEFKNTKEDSAFAMSRNRSAEYFPYYFRPKSDLDPDISMRIEGVKEDSVVGPFISRNKFVLMKVSDFKKNPAEPFVKIRHILILPKGNTAQDSASAFMQAQIQSSMINSDNFTQYLSLSDDSQTKNQGGELGWYRWGAFGKEFDEGLKKGEKGKILALKSKYGAHIVEIMDKQVEGVRLAMIAYDIEPSTETISNLMEKADLFRSDITDTTSFTKKANTQKLIINRTSPLTINSAAQNFIGGLSGANVREIITWGLNTEKGKICDRPFEVDNAIVVAIVASKSNSDYKPIENVKDLIHPRVMANLKAQKILEKLNKVKSKGDLEKIREAYGEGAFTQKAEGVSFANASIPGYGPDYPLIGKIFQLPANKISDPIVGTTGVYIVKILSIQEPTKQDDKALEEYRLSLQATKRSQFQNKVSEGLRDWAKIKDNRFLWGL